MSQMNDLTGKRFGRLVAETPVKELSPRSGRSRVKWVCKCDCGNTIAAYPDNLLSGKSQSCGCLRKELLSSLHKTHGKSETKLYGVWSSMKARCYNPHAPAYKDYGGRGIRVCEDWLHNFESFESWAIGLGYRDGLSIDRIDNNQSYSPDNCRLVDGVAQANNRRSNVLLSYNGETHNVTEWAHILDMPPKTLFSRLYAGMTTEQILNK